MEDPIKTLREACDFVIANKNFAPVKDSSGAVITTFCNIASAFVARAMGCIELDGLMADEIYNTMASNKSGRWMKVSGEAASLHARVGGLAFAAMTSKMLGEAHGHVAAVYPAPLQHSGSLDKDVPVVANVGKTDAEEKESLAFPVSKGEPDYFTWA